MICTKEEGQLEKDQCKREREEGQGKREEEIFEEEREERENGTR